jgi:hypothetical protein
LDCSVSIGEFSRFWTRYLEGKSNCGCGENIKDCVLWSKIINEIVLKFEMSLLETEEKILQIRLFKNFSKIDQFILDPKWKEFCNLITYVYQRIFELTNSQIVIDSSKYPSWGYFLFKLDIGEFHFIHLERNLTEVANSWKKTKLLPEYEDQVYMPIKSNYTILKSWIKIKYLCNEIRKTSPLNCLFIEYEEFCKSPSLFLKEIENLIEEKFPSQNFKFFKNHAIGGNPMRLESKALIIKDSRAELSNLNILESLVFKSFNKLLKSFL